MDLRHELTTRLHTTHPDLPNGVLVVAVGAALVLVLVPALWQRLRIAVTLVHELGHALVGVLVGRRFTGFVVRGDMSGHAVTVGRPRGPGRIATTWAGYPAPALVGLLMVWAVTAGGAARLLLGVLAVLLLALVFVRSLGTLATVLVGAVAVGALWWWRDDQLQATVLTAAGLVLLAGAWRHLAALVTPAGRRDRGSDARVLRDLTGLPATVWVATFALVLLAATGQAVRLLVAA